MRSTVLTRAALATAASVMALAPLPLAACSTGSDPAPSASRSASTTRPASPGSSAASVTPDHEGGTYNAMGEYGSGHSYLDVTITTDEGVVTEVTVEPPVDNDTSRGTLAQIRDQTPSDG